jgi:hypothetical protein
MYPSGEYARRSSAAGTSNRRLAVPAALRKAPAVVTCERVGAAPRSAEALIFSTEVSALEPRCADERRREIPEFVSDLMNEKDVGPVPLLDRLRQR